MYLNKYRPAGAGAECSNFRWPMPDLRYQRAGAYAAIRQNNFPDQEFRTWVSIIEQRNRKGTALPFPLHMDVY